jgi:uncharacterized membrane protein
MIDSNNRSIAKTISWRLTGSFSTFMISYLILGSFTIAGSIAIIQIITNTILYYLHERVWNKVNWGRTNF